MFAFHVYDVWPHSLVASHLLHQLLCCLESGAQPYLDWALLVLVQLTYQKSFFESRDVMALLDSLYGVVENCRKVDSSPSHRRLHPQRITRRQTHSEYLTSSASIVRVDSAGVIVTSELVISVVSKILRNLAFSVKNAQVLARHGKTCHCLLELLSSSNTEVCCCATDDDC